jgi:hypothetical protein
MVKSVNNKGASLDRRILAAAAKDERPITFEVIEFDGRDGPITGVHEGNDGPRVAVMSTRVWKSQGYTPQKGDERATGTLYFNTQALCERFNTPLNSQLSPLDEWSMRPLMSAATCPLDDQIDVFEDALSDLLSLLLARPLLCPRERGARTL